jgi:hypothetical protein
LPSWCSPLPAEGYGIWDHCQPTHGEAYSRPLLERDLSEQARNRLIRSISSHLYFARAKRFLNKNTRNTRRILYLNAIFDDALFIHLVRDGRAVANSLLNVAFWPDLHLWWRDGITPRALEANGEDRVILAAKHWEQNVLVFVKHSQSLPPERILQIRYEDLISEPKRILETVLQFCKLKWDAAFNQHYQRFHFENRNIRANRLSEDELRKVESSIRGTLNLFNYD